MSKTFSAKLPDENNLQLANITEPCKSLHKTPHIPLSLCICMQVDVLVYTHTHTPLFLSLSPSSTKSAILLYSSVANKKDKSLFEFLYLLEVDVKLYRQLSIRS